MSLHKWYKNKSQPIQSANASSLTDHSAPITDHGVGSEIITPSFLDVYKYTRQQNAKPEPLKPPMLKSLPSGITPGRAPRTRFFDPLSLMYATG